MMVTATMMRETLLNVVLTAEIVSHLTIIRHMPNARHHVLDHLEMVAVMDLSQIIQLHRIAKSVCLTVEIV